MWNKIKTFFKDMDLNSVINMTDTEQPYRDIYLDILYVHMSPISFFHKVPESNASHLRILQSSFGDFILYSVIFISINRKIKV